LFGWRQPAKGKLIKIDPDRTPTFNLSRQPDNFNRELDHASLVRRRTPRPDVARDEDVFVRQRRTASSSAAVADYGGVARLGFFASVEDQSRALPVGNPSVRMRNDRHEPNGAKKQRPERIPIDPEHRSYSRNATAAMAIDSLFQNSGRREHDYATRRIRRLGTDLRIAADTLTFLDFACHGSVSLQFQNCRSPGKCASRHWNASLGHASVYKNVVIRQRRWRVSSGGGSPERAGFPRQFSR
jgi:hypothetical protein